MAENVFFLHHEHREGGGKATGDVSKHNDWEVSWLVLSKFRI
jgi:hypothetical protein